MNPMPEMAVEETGAMSVGRIIDSAEGKAIPTQMRMKGHPSVVSAVAAAGVVQ
jgi:hypothetical protein